MLRTRVHRAIHWTEIPQENVVKEYGLLPLHNVKVNGMNLIKINPVDDVIIP